MSLIGLSCIYYPYELCPPTLLVAHIFLIIRTLIYWDSIVHEEQRLRETDVLRFLTL